MIFGEGPIIKNIAGDLNKLFLQGSRVNQPINNVEGDAAADQATVQLMADRDPVIRDISTGLGWAGREVTVSGTGALQLVNSLGRPLKSWSVELAPYQEGSGDPSPENVRRIYGTSKLTFNVSGRNLFSGIRNGYYAQSTGNFVSNILYNASNQIDVLGATNYSFSINGVRTSAFLYQWDAMGNYLGRTNTSSSVPFTTDPAASKIALASATQNKWDDGALLQLEFGDITTDYTPFTTHIQTTIDMPALGKNILNIEAGTHNAWSFVNIPNNLKPNTQYTLSLNGGTTYYYGLYLGNSQQSTRALTPAITGGESATFTTPSDMSTEPLLALAGSVSGAGNESLSNILPQVEFGPTKTSYEPYTNTLYSGTVGSEGGESRSGAIHFSDLTWTANGSFSNTFNGEGFIDRQTQIDGSNANGCYCDRYKWYTSGTVGTSDGGIALANTASSSLLTMTRIYVKDTRFSTVQEFVASFATEDPLVVCPLAEPVQFPLTAPTIPTPNGTATTWATAEDGTVESMEVTYIKSE